jgi:hypothetical protein
MPKPRNVATLMLLVAALVLMMGFGGCPPSPPAAPPLNPLTLLPTDACASTSCMPPPLAFSDVCTVSTATFNGWFSSGTASAGGGVNPANSVSFKNTPNCSFYQWAKQDFLWLTSPTTSAYGGNGLILDSTAFYDVTPPSGGKRTLLPHSSGFIHPLVLRAAQVGAGGLQVTFDAGGEPIQVKLAKPGTILKVRTASGQLVQVAHARLGANGKPVLLDLKSTEIQAQRSLGARPEARANKAGIQVPTMLAAEKFIIDGVPIFTDPALAVIDVEQGEAGTNGVLEAQTTAGGSLVYYATIVNDVYAYYATAVANNAFTLASDGLCTPSTGVTCFPTTSGQLSQITTYGTAHGHTFPPGEANALAIEVKSAWVEAAGLPNLNSYITMNATIPVYSPPSPTSTTTTMTDTGKQQTVQLALVGMHVVGSAAGHPEMIWSTFEHVNNAPPAPYSYINNTGTAGAPVTATVGNVAQLNSNAGTLPTIGGNPAPWVFSTTTATSFNNQNMSYNGPPTSPATITANTPPGIISPSNTMRYKAFGGASDVDPNPVDPSPAASNTEIISLNNSTMPPSGDVRNNYIMTGATWTIGGAAPNSFTGGNQVGTSSLANTTMETYVQGVASHPTNQSGGFNCLSCHVTNTTGVSHVFINQATGTIGLNPLFP